MHTVAYVALHTLDTLPGISTGALGDNCYLTNTLQGYSKLFQGDLHTCTGVCRGF